MKAFGSFGYDAIAACDQKLPLGGARLLAHAGRFPLMAHNLSLRPDIEPPPPLSDETLVVEKPRSWVGVVALLDPSVLQRYPPAILDSIRITSPETAARRQPARLSAEAVMLRVLLFHGLSEAAERLAASVAGLDVIVVGHDGGLHEPRRIRGAALVSPGEEGNCVGMLEITIARTLAGRPRAVRFANSFRRFGYQSDPDDPLVRKRTEDSRGVLRVRTETIADTP